MNIRTRSSPTTTDNTPGRDRYVLRLFVAGMSSRARRAVENVRRICDAHLVNRYDLEIVDVYQQPALTRAEQIVAAPTLIKKLPLPSRRIIGDMSRTDRVLVGLDLSSPGEHVAKAT